MVATIIGYATFYFVRKNLSIAMPVMEKSLGVTKADLGLFLTLHGVLYGVSKFVNGFFGDRCHVRTFMVTGLVLSATVNVCLRPQLGGGGAGDLLDDQRLVSRHGLSALRAGLHPLGPAQGTGDQDVHLERLDQHRRGDGGGDVQLPAQLLRQLAAVLLCAGSARLPLRGVPLVRVARHAAVGRPARGRRHPKSRPPRGDSDDWKAVAVKYVFSNPYIWLLAVANFFVYTIRYAMLDWGPTLLTQAKHLQLTHAGWMVAGFEISGMIGALIGGWLTDRLFGGRGFRSCVFYMAAGRRLGAAVLEGGGPIGLAQHPAALPLGLLHLRPAMPHQHRRRQSRHQTRRRHRRRA